MAGSAGAAALRLTARARQSQWKSLAIHLAFLLPLSALTIGAGIAAFALTDSLGIGIAVLCSWPPSLFLAGAVARRVDFATDASNSCVVVDGAAITLPDGTHIPRASLNKVSPGWYDRRPRPTQRSGTARCGVFLHVRWDGDKNVLLWADDGIGDADQRGIRRYRDAPDDMDEVRVWASELMPLISALQ